MQLGGGGREALEINFSQFHYLSKKTLLRVDLRLISTGKLSYHLKYTRETLCCAISKGILLSIYSFLPGLRTDKA